MSKGHLSSSFTADNSQIWQQPELYSQHADFNNYLAFILASMFVGQQGLGNLGADDDDRVRSLSYDPAAFAALVPPPDLTKCSIISVGPQDTEFAGTFVNVPHMKKTGGASMCKTSMKLGITSLLDDLDVNGDDTIVVTLTPKIGEVKIGGVKIDYITE
ncbi:(+)-larreatricin hydroxylase, chloroplastic [Linum perenne]